MTERGMRRWGLIVWVCLGAWSLMGQDIPLPAPRTDGSCPSVSILSQRESTRSFRSDPLPRRVVGEMLWAALGVNRPLSGHRTTNFSWASRDTGIYVASAQGVFLYRAEDHALVRVLDDDIRSRIDPAYAQAPVTFIYVSDDDRLTSAGSSRDCYAAIHAGFCAANVYWYAAAESLGALVRSSFPESLAQTLNMRAQQHVLLVQTLGYASGAPVPSGAEICSLAEGALPMAQIEDTEACFGLRERRSVRSFSPAALPTQVLGELLWCGVGLNRPESGKRTSPSAYNSQDVAIYVAMASGAYRYRPSTHDLEQVSAEDIRSSIDANANTAHAPVTLLFVSDKGTLPQTLSDQEKKRYAWFDTGFASQNVSAYCAAERMGALVRSSISNRSAVRTALGLTGEGAEQKEIVIIQTIGSWSAQPASSTINFSADVNGSLEGALQQSIPFGQAATAVTAVPDEGFRFDGWSGGIGGTCQANPLTLAHVTAGMNLVAHFVPAEEVLAVVSPNGSERWRRGEARMITWTSSLTEGTVVLELLRQGEVVGTIAELPATQTSYAWVVGQHQGGMAAASEGYGVRVRKK